MVERSFVYILASQKNGTLYIGVTNNLERRVFEHKEKLIDGFTRTYDVDRLVHYEESPSIKSAIQREKQLKHWNRAWKIQLIESINPSWEDFPL